MKRTPKILCLHGWAQNATTFRQKSSALRKKLGWCELVYVASPLPNNPADSNDEGRAWFNVSEEVASHENRAALHEIVYERLDEVYDFLETVMIEQGMHLAH